jgi:hypothetical protein
MVKFLIVNEWIHHKNRLALERMLKYLNYDYMYGDANTENIKNNDIIYIASHIIDIYKYPNKFFIFGPHLSVFPDHRIEILKDRKNCIYIQPSDWTTNVWRSIGVEKYVRMKTLPFSVDVNKFTPGENKSNVFVYIKRRDPNEIGYLYKFLNKFSINYHEFNYVKGYTENNYLDYLKTCKFGIILGAHESQGFAIEEALSCDVPLLVWNTKTMNQEYRSSYSNIECTTIPYWDERCGEYFYYNYELEDAYLQLTSGLLNKKYKPREFILENLTDEKWGEKMKAIISEFCIKTD